MHFAEVTVSCSLEFVNFIDSLSHLSCDTLLGRLPNRDILEESLHAHALLVFYKYPHHLLLIVTFNLNNQPAR